MGSEMCIRDRLGPFPHPLVSLVSANHATTLNLVQPPWNFVAEFGIAGNPNKGYSVCSQLNQTEPCSCHRLPSLLAGLSHGFYFSSRARVVLGSELLLPMSFSWPVFPGLDQDLFPPMVFLVFWDSIPKRCKGVHCVDPDESFPTSIYLQKLASCPCGSRFFWRRTARTLECRWRERSKQLRATATEPQHPADELDEAVACEVETIAERQPTAHEIVSSRSVAPPDNRAQQSSVKSVVASDRRANSRKKSKLSLIHI